MLKVKLGRQYPRDVQRLRERGKDTSELAKLVGLLMQEAPLPPIYKDHPLKGDLHNYRDAHLPDANDDWVLIYRTSGQRLYLMRTGTHAEVFRGKKRRKT
ncbi:MAG: type II toxin-antitoxin system YafQ family toxin [Ottowia sp.]|nr:type II toxin-antitoxin system YafQ family toxin [Ottowia sp.]